MTWTTDTSVRTTAVTLLCAVTLLAAACSDSGPDRDAASAATRSTPTERSASTTPSSTSTIDPTRNNERIAEVAATVDAYVTAQGLNGAALVVVDRDQGVVWEHYVGAMTPQRPTLIASASKMLTAGVLLRLQDQGLIDLNRPVADAVPWGSANPTVTPAQLLSNSSGLVGLADGPTFAPYLCQYLAAGSLQDCGKQIFTTADDDDRVIAPDSKFRYGGGQWQVAGAVAEAVSSKSWAELIDETYVQPCKVASLSYKNHFAQITSDAGPFSYPTKFNGDPSTLASTHNPNMEGGAYINPRDYAQLLLMHLRGGRCGDEQVLSKAAVRQAHTDRLGAFGTQTGNDQGYGLGWWINRDDPSRQQDGGAFGTEPWIDLDRGYAAVLVLESTSPKGVALLAQIRPLVDQVMDEMP